MFANANGCFPSESARAVTCGPDPRPHFDLARRAALGQLRMTLGPPGADEAAPLHVGVLPRADLQPQDARAPRLLLRDREDVERQHGPLPVVRLLRDSGAGCR